MLSTIPLAHKSLKTYSCFIVKKNKNKKKFLYCPTFSPLQCTMESRVTNCLDFTGKGHVLKQFISCHPDTPQAAFPPKAKNLTIPFCVTFFTYFDLHSQSTFISIRLCICGFGEIVGGFLAFSLA